MNKYLSECGACSRREADRLIEAGKVFVNNAPAELGTRVDPGDVVMLSGRIVRPEKGREIYAYHKPEGLVCTAAEADKQSIYLHAEIPKGMFYVGRLDKDSSGLLLLTNDGDLANRIQRARNGHEKEYRVRVNREITEEFLKGMAGGVPILDTVTAPCTVKKNGSRSFTIILTQGMNRQIRRMCEYFGYQVTHLKRVRVMNILLADLRPNALRKLSREEETTLRNMVEEGAIMTKS